MSQVSASASDSDPDGVQSPSRVPESVTVSESKSAAVFSHGVQAPIRRRVRRHCRLSRVRLKFAVFKFSLVRTDTRVSLVCIKFQVRLG